MMKGLGDLGNLLKMQRELKSIQKKISKSTIDGWSPDGKIQIKITGEYKVVDISIDEELLKAENKQSIENSMIKAMNDAVDKMKANSASQMGGVGGMMDMMGLGKQ